MMKTPARLASEWMRARCLGAAGAEYATVNGPRMDYRTHGTPSPRVAARVLPLPACAQMADAGAARAPVKAAYMRAAPDPQHWREVIAKVERSSLVAAMEFTFLDSGK
jgi:hypothetical protein